MVTFDVNDEDRYVIDRIADRAAFELSEFDFVTSQMDLRAVHANGCPLDLQALLGADRFTFAHDFYGIRRHLNRETGELEDCFLPRCARPESAEA